jgi:GNAT superfamily N-acetyltransferase
VPASPPFRIEPLDKQNRSTFDCGVQPLNDYLKSTATQDRRRGLATCFVALHTDSNELAGYYTLFASTVALHELPKGHNFGRYTSVPAVLIGRLAVAQRFQGQGLGRVLLLDAMRQTAASTIAAALLTVEAKDDRAALFYRHCGFQTYRTANHHFFLSIQDIKRIFPGGQLRPQRDHHVSRLPK